MPSTKTFANDYTPKRNPFLRLPSLVVLTAQAFIAGLVACAGMIAIFHYMMGLWFLALLFLVVTGVFAFAFRAVMRFWRSR